MRVVTVPERRAARVAAIRAAIIELRASLSAYGRRHGGRFVLYGSAARGNVRHSSDVDLLVDFPDDDSTHAAFTFAEQDCARLALLGDIRPQAACSRRFLDHIAPDAVSLP